MCGCGSSHQNTTRPVDFGQRDSNELDTGPERDHRVPTVGDGRVFVGEAPQHRRRQHGRGESEHDERVDGGDPHVGPSDGDALLRTQAPRTQSRA